MRTLSMLVISLLLIATSACRKKKITPPNNDCFPAGEIVRQEKNMTVTVMMVIGDLCEVGPDIPTGYWYYACNIPEELREKGKKLRITGIVKTRPGADCCVYNFVVTSATAL